MTALYNEMDPRAAAWLRELIRDGLIADGIVDERSIEDILPSEIIEFTQVHLFAGIGVWSYALRQAGWPDDRPVWTASCPCQPFSAAGEGKGFDDERHLWPALHWLIAQCQPVTVFGEQVAGKAGDAWFDTVSTDLEGEGYASGSVVFPACSVGAPHMRQRRYWVADSESAGVERPARREAVSSRDGSAQSINSDSFTLARNALAGNFESLLQRDGITVGMERGCIKGYGNALAAPQAQAFIEVYSQLTRVLPASNAATASE